MELIISSNSIIIVQSLKFFIMRLLFTLTLDLLIPTLEHGNEKFLHFSNNSFENNYNCGGYK